MEYNSKPLVSIVIPVYNVELYLDRCLESVINQDYENIEIILVDDGSTDDSPNICDRYKNKFPNLVKVIHQENQGASLTRLKGIKESTGEFMMFVDSDDYVLPDYVSSLYNAIIKFNTLIAVCPFERRKYDGVTKTIGKTCEPITLDYDILLKRFFKYEFWGFGGGIYHRSLFYDVVFPSTTVNEDYYVKAQIFTKVRNVAYVREPKYIYELHENSLSNQKLSLRALGEFDNAKATWEYIKDKNPPYSNLALAIASEAASKWLISLNQQNYVSDDYLKYKKKIQQFVNNNLFSILFNHHFLWKIKIVILYNYLKSLITKH